MRISLTIVSVSLLAVLGTITPSYADNAQCESDLAKSWKAQPPILGLGDKSAVGAYVGNITALMQKWNLPGMGVAIAFNGRLVLALGIGFADIDNLQLLYPDRQVLLVLGFFLFFFFFFGRKKKKRK